MFSSTGPERIYCGIPYIGEIMAYDDWRDFADALWASQDDATRADYETADIYAQCCLLSQNGVFMVTDRPDGRIDVEHVG